MQVSIHVGDLDADELAEEVCGNREVLDKVFEFACENDPDGMNVASAALVAGIHWVVMPLVRRAFIDGHLKKYEHDEAENVFVKFLPALIEVVPIRDPKGRPCRLSEPVYVGPDQIKLALELLWNWADIHSRQTAKKLFDEVYDHLREDMQTWFFDNWVEAGQ